MDSRQRYLELIGAEEDRWDVFEIALELCRIIQPRLEPQPYREILGKLVGEVRSRLGGRRVGSYEHLEALNVVLFEQYGFEGNSQDYYNPANSYVSRVLETRKGIPITLCIVYREVAQRTGLSLQWVGFPGHFLLKYRNDGRELFVDPFQRGQLLLEVECEELFHQLFGPGETFQKEYLASVSHRQVVIRLLTNLREIYRRRNHLRLLLEVLERRVPLLDDPLPELLERGLVYLALENYREALGDLEYFVRHTPNRQMREVIEAQLQRVRALAQGN